MNNDVKRTIIIFEKPVSDQEKDFFAVSKKLKKHFEDSACMIEVAPQANTYRLVENRKPVTAAALHTLFNEYSFKESNPDILGRYGLDRLPPHQKNNTRVFLAQKLAP